jgi:hypothetical protein
MLLPLRPTLISMEGVPPSCGSREAELLEDLRDVRGARPACDREFSQQRRATYRRLISRSVSYLYHYIVHEFLNLDLLIALAPMYLLSNPSR